MKIDARTDSGARQKRIEDKPDVTAPFFVQYGDSLSSLFDTLGVAHDFDTNLEAIVDATQPWAKGDHHAPEKPLELSLEQQTQALRLFDKMGMLGEIKPQGGEYDQVLLLGGEQHSNRLRIAYFKDQLNAGNISIAPGGSLISLGGVRKLKGREIKDLGEDLVIAAKEPMVDPWTTQLLARDMHDALDEDAAMRVALIAQVGSAAMRLGQSHIKLDSADIFSHRVFRGENENNVVMINAPAVDRPLGPRRHTTESSLKEWLRLASPSYNSRVLLVSNNPYIHRTARNLANTIMRERPDISFDYCGAPAEQNHTIIQRTLGEITRNLYEDLHAS